MGGASSIPTSCRSGFPKRVQCDCSKRGWVNGKLALAERVVCDVQDCGRHVAMLQPVEKPGKQPAKVGLRHAEKRGKCQPQARRVCRRIFDKVLRELLERLDGTPRRHQPQNVIARRGIERYMKVQSLQSAQQLIDLRMPVLGQDRRLPPGGEGLQDHFQRKIVVARCRVLADQLFDQFPDVSDGPMGEFAERRFQRRELASVASAVDDRLKNLGDGGLGCGIFIIYRVDAVAKPRRILSRSSNSR